MEGARNDGVSSGSGLRLGTPRLSTRHLVRAAEQVVHRARQLARTGRNRRSSLGQRLVKARLKMEPFHPLLVGRTPRAFGFAETGTGFDTRS